MIEEPAVTAWKAEEEAKNFLRVMIRALLLGLHARFGMVPKDVADTICTCEDEEQIRVWAGKEVRASSIDQFRKDTGL